MAKECHPEHGLLLFLLFALPDGNSFDSSLLLKSSSQPQDLPPCSPFSLEPSFTHQLSLPFHLVAEAPVSGGLSWAGLGEVSSLLSVPKALSLSEPLHSLCFIVFFVVVVYFIS